MGFLKEGDLTFPTQWLRSSKDRVIIVMILAATDTRRVKNVTWFSFTCNMMFQSFVRLQRDINRKDCTLNVFVLGSAVLENVSGGLKIYWHRYFYFIFGSTIYRTSLHSCVCVWGGGGLTYFHVCCLLYLTTPFQLQCVNYVLDRKKLSWPISRYCTSIFLDVLMEVTKRVTLHTQRPGKESNPGTPEYEAEVVTLGHDVHCYQVQSNYKCSLQCRNLF
jgi:hypothetical protein